MCRNRHIAFLNQTNASKHIPHHNFRAKIRFGEVPGGIFENEPNNEWSHLRVVLANGKKDGDSWLLESKATYEKLLPVVSSIEIMVISGQNHTISNTYDINQIYSKLFENS